MTPSVYKSVASTLKLSWCINFILVLSIRFYSGSLDASLTVMVQSEITIKENWTTKKPDNKPNTQENRKEQNRTSESERKNKKKMKNEVHLSTLTAAVVRLYYCIHFYLFFFFFWIQVDLLSTQTIRVRLFVNDSNNTAMYGRGFCWFFF